MRTSTWLLKAALAWMICSSVAAAEDCQLKRLVSIDMVGNRNEVQIPVELNGIHLRMAIDIGNGLSGIWSGATEALGLQPKKTIATGVLLQGERSLTQTVKVQNLKIGDARWVPFPALVYPSKEKSDQSFSQDDVGGILGMDVFSSVDLELDFAARQVRLYSQKHCRGHVVYWTTDRYAELPFQRSSIGSFYMSMAINGRLVSTGLSTVSTHTLLEEESARRVLGMDPSFLAGGEDEGGTGCSHCRSINLAVDGLEIQNANVSVVSLASKRCRLSVPSSQSEAASYDCAGAYPLRLGFDVLSKLHLYFANAEKKLYLTDANATAKGALK